jgi:hypothetical protein
MEVKIIEECGYESALKGMAYSYLDESVDINIWWDSQYEKSIKRSKSLADKDGGHNKFLESIQVWINIKSTRAFWQEFDTYRIGVTKQSSSTMHKLDKREPIISDFSKTTNPKIIEAFIEIWKEWKDGKYSIVELKDSLPEGYLQSRIVCTNYKVLRHIINQRKDHRYYYWQDFCNGIMKQIEHPEFLEDVVK